MNPPDTFPNDPFFKAGKNSEWNACIGSQGYELNYLDGYIEGAIEMANAVTEKKLYSQRDTLVLPILYTARHGVELALKFSTNHLYQAGIIKGDGVKLDHDVMALWDRLNDAKLPDTQLSQSIRDLKPFIDSLAAIDEDGQELRYYKNREEGKSLSKYSLANLEVIQGSLAVLKDLIDRLKYRTLDYADEFKFGKTTNLLSQADLKAIAKLLPSTDTFGDDNFLTIKAEIMASYGIANGQFSKAVQAIKANREMAGMIGVETNLLYITDEQVISTVQRWRRIHPPKIHDPNDLGVNWGDPSRFSPEAIAARLEQHNEEQKIITEVQADLSSDALAELEAMYYFGRNGIHAEEHKANVEQVQKEHAAAKNPLEKIRHLMEKTNFLHCLEIAAPKLGRLDLAKRLSGI